MKKLVSVVLSFLLLAALIPLDLHTASADTSGQCGDNLYWSFDGTTGTLTITGSGEMWGFEPNEQPWADYLNQIVSVNLPDGVTSIGGDAFSDCTGLQSITIPNSVISIGYNAFYGCTGLTMITLGDGVTSIDDYAFYNCARLTDVYYSATETQRQCITINSYNDPLLNATWHYSGEEPSGDEAVMTLTLDKDSYDYRQRVLVTATVTCPESFTEEQIAAYEEASTLLTLINDTGDPVPGYAVQGSTGLTVQCGFPLLDEEMEEGVYAICAEKTVGDNTISAQASFYYTGYQDTPVNTEDCTIALTLNTDTFGGGELFKMTATVTDPDGNPIQGAQVFFTILDSNGELLPFLPFGDYHSLYNITGEEGRCSIGIRPNESEDGWHAGTYMCKIECDQAVDTALFTFTGDGDPTSGQCGDNLYWSFDEDTGTLTITGSGAMYDFDFITGIGENPWSRFRSEIRTVILPEGITTIGSHAFDNHADLTSITIPDSVESIGWCAFRGCTGLETVIIGSSLIDINNQAFENCTGLTSITFPDSVTHIGPWAFQRCTELTTVTIGNGLTEIGSCAFAYCDSLSQYIVAQDNITFCSADGVLYSKDKDRLVLYPAGKTQLIYEVPDTVTTIKAYAFTGCQFLSSLTITDSVNDIERFAFQECFSLTAFIVTAENETYCASEGVLFTEDMKTLIAYPIGNSHTAYTIPDGVDLIERCAFQSCANLISVTIPDSVTTIDGHAFKYCTGLTSIEIPGNVTSMGTCAFSGCTSIVSVTIPGSIESIENCAFSDCISLTNAIIGNGIENIGDLAFYACPNLASITIPSSVKAIGWGSFGECENLTDVYYGGTMTQKAEISIDNEDGENELLLNAAWHCTYDANDTVLVTDTVETTIVSVQEDTETEAQATIPADAFSNEEETNKPVEIQAQVATIVFNKQAAGAIAVNAGTTDIQVSIEVTPDEQQEDVITVEISVQTAYEEAVFAEGNAEGSADVTVPYAVTAGNEPVVFLISGEERIPVKVITYNAGSVTFRVQHFSTYEVAQQVIPPLLLNETNFPDENFRAWLFNTAMMFTEGAIEAQQENGVYYLTHEQVMTLDDLDISGEEISDLTGLEKLENLQNFMMHGISAASLDLSALPVLKSCDFSDMENLTSLKLPASVEQVFIDAALTSLDLSNCSSLSVLEMYGTGLSTLDVSLNTNLTYVKVVDSEVFTTLILGSQPKLACIEIERTGLSSLNLNGCTALTELYCPNNHLAELSLPDTVELTSFSGDGQTVTGQGQIQNTDPRWYIFYMGNLFSEYTSLSRVSVPVPQAEISSGPDDTGAIVNGERFHSFYYDYEVTAEYSMRVTVNVTYFDEEEIDLSDVSGWQSLSLNELGWIWNDHVLTSAQAKIVADGCDTLSLSILSCPSAEDETVYADNMARVGRLYIDIETEGDGALTFTFPEANQPSWWITTIDSYSLLPVTINAADSAGNFDLIVSGGTLTFNGDVSTLELKQWYAPYEPFTEDNESRDVHINGSVYKLKWNGETFVSDASVEWYYGRYRGALTVNGSITEGIEYGSVFFDIEGLSGLAFNVPVKRISKTAEDDPLVIQKGGLLQITDYEEIVPTVDEILLQYKYADHLGDDTDSFRWAVSVRMTEEDEGSEVMLPIEFSEESIHFGSNTTVVIEGPGTSLSNNPQAFGKELVTLNGDLAKLEVFAAPVLLNGDVTYARIYDYGSSFSGSSDVVLNGVVGELQLDGCHLKTTVRTGENGSIQGGDLRKTQYKLINSSTASVYTLYERYFENVEANTDVMRNGTLKVMSKSWEERWASILADSDAIAEAANLTDNQYAVMTIQNESSDLSESEAALIDTVASGADAVSAFDVSIMSYTTNAYGNVYASAEATDLNGNDVTFYLETPTDDPNASYQVIRLHEENGEMTATVVGYADAEDGRVEVSSSLFSKFVVVSIPKEKGVTITLDPCNGDDPTTITIPVGGTLSELPVPEYEGYQLIGWFLNAGTGAAAGTGTAVTLETVFNEDTTIYANWYLPGDVNGDGIVNNKDVTRLLKYLAGDDVEVVLFACDINGDGSVNNKDVTRLLKYLAGDNVVIH